MLPTIGALRWMWALVRVPLVMYWVPLPPVLPLAPGFFAGEGVVGGVPFGWCWWHCWRGCRSHWFWLWPWAWLVVGFRWRGPSPLLAGGLLSGAASWSTRLS